MLFALEGVREEADEGPVGKCRNSANDLCFECEGDKNIEILDSG